MAGRRNATAPTEIEKARIHAALGDPLRLAVAEALAESDRAVGELVTMFDVASNLLAHHVARLVGSGLVVSRRSAGDGRRRYLHLVPDVARSVGIMAAPPTRAPAALFVCTRNSARSQLGAAVWSRRTKAPSTSAGTHPARTIHPGAVRAARRAGLDLGSAVPRMLDDVVSHWRPASASFVVITVCDQAHEELGDAAPIPGATRVHWSIPDPIVGGTAADFDAVAREIDSRITARFAPDTAPVD
jgi:protein-tyrosine-phosphatase/DNA-binding transcriptional ArsR family regulator